MAPLSDYVTGTITLTNGSAAFTGSGTGWLAAAFREGDTILGIEDNPGVTYVIESITDNDAGTLTQPWDGPTGTYTYRMRYLPDGTRSTAQARTLIELLGNGNLQALAGLDGTPNTLAMFTGAGAMVEVPRTELVSGANYDVQVDTLPGRDAYDGQDEGFSVLVSNTGDGRAAIYSKLSATSGDWSDPAYVTGPAVTLDVGSVTPVAFGSDPDVTLNPVAGGYEFDFELPENATFQSGTITTLDPGEDATFSLSPVVGGYALNLGVPRGPTGDIDGVTAFWQGRITVDADAAAARAGLGLVKTDNTTDTTGGRLLTVGSYGFGGPCISISNWDDVNVNGAIYFAFNGNNAPASGIDIIGVYHRLTDTYGVLEVGTTTGSAARMWRRIKNGGVWGAWVEFWNGDLPAEIYKRSNILGPVSQSGGVPTGAIIEEDSNANGRYTKFADGTMICSHSSSMTTVGTSTVGGVYRNATAIDFTFPAAFAGSNPKVTYAPTEASGGPLWAAHSTGSLSLTGISGLFMLTYGTPAPSARISYIAIGRWF